MKGIWHCHTAHLLVHIPGRQVEPFLQPPSFARHLLKNILYRKIRIPPLCSSHFSYLLEKYRAKVFFPQL